MVVLRAVAETETRRARVDRVLAAVAASGACTGHKQLKPERRSGVPCSLEDSAWMPCHFPSQGSWHELARVTSMSRPSIRKNPVLKTGHGVTTFPRGTDVK